MTRIGLRTGTLLRSTAFFCWVFLLFPAVLPESVSSAPSGIPAYEKARQYERQGRRTVALEHYEIAFGNHPGHLDSGLGLLRNAVLMERWEVGKRVLPGLEKAAPNSPRVAKWATRLFFHNDGLDTALAWARRYQSRAPGGWLPLHFIARIAFRQGRDERARSVLEQARIRAPDQPWVNLLSFRVTKRLQGTENDAWLARALERGTDPTLFWEAVQAKKHEWSASRVEDVLTSGLQYFDGGSRPPLRKPVSRSTYRYWIARLAYTDDESSKARRTIAPLSSPFRVKWLQAMLLSRPQPKLDAMRTVLRQHPDHPTQQWTYSRLARRREDIPGDHRVWGSQFFFEQYTRNRMLDLREAAYSSLVRSLELRPVNSNGQFELAQFLHRRGWNRIQHLFLNRADELGFEPPGRVDDYREGLSEAPAVPSPGIVQARLGVQVGTESFWDGPVQGERALTSMLRQAFHHQPAFVPEKLPPRNGTSRLIPAQFQTGRTNHVIRVGIRRWDGVLDSRLIFRLPGGEKVERDFQAEGIMKEWKLLDEVIHLAKRLWPWEATVYETTPNGAWINLGRVHGIDTGDTFVVHQSSFQVDRVLERRARLQFRTPVQETVIPRGATAVRKRRPLRSE